MSDLKQAKELLDEINRAISGYDPVLKENGSMYLTKPRSGGVKLVKA